MISTSRLSALVALSMLALATATAPAEAQTRLDCLDYGTHVVCENGQTYLSPGSFGGGGGAVIINPPAEPDFDERRLSKGQIEAFEDLIDEYARMARSDCREVAWAASAQRKQCERQRLAELVEATDDPELIDFYEDVVRNAR